MAHLQVYISPRASLAFRRELTRLRGVLPLEGNFGDGYPFELPPLPTFWANVMVVSIQRVFWTCHGPIVLFLGKPWRFYAARVPDDQPESP